MPTQVLPPVKMPQLSGGRERARSLIAPLIGKMRGLQVHLDCRNLIAGTSSFADELISGVLVNGHAAGLVVEYASGDFAEHLRDAAKDHGVLHLMNFL